MTARVIDFRPRRRLIVPDSPAPSHAHDQYAWFALDVTVEGCVGKGAMAAVRRLAILWQRGEDAQCEVLAALEEIGRRTKRRR